MTNPIPQEPTVFGAPGHWASGDDLGGQAALRAEEARQSCPGMPLPVGDAVPRCGVFGSHHPHKLGEAVRWRAFNGMDQASATFAEVFTNIGPPPGWTPEHTGVNDVRVDVLAETKKLDRLITEYASARVRVVDARTDEESKAAFALGNDLNVQITDALNRIESLVRGEQR